MSSSNEIRPGVAYTRLSSVKERDRAAGNDDLNVADQQARVRKLADAVAVPIDSVFTDNDLTAYKGTKRYKGRPGFDAMLRRLDAGDIGVIFVYHVFRLYRSLSDLERLSALCVKHKISIKAVSGGDIDLTSPTGQMTAEFLASVGKQQVALLAESSADGRARIRAAGRWPGGRVPYGYRVTGDFGRGTGEVHIVEDEARVIRGMCDDILAGKSLNDIARKLNADCVRRPGKALPASRTVSPRRVGWDQSQVGRMVTNPRYAAQIEYKGEIAGDGDWPEIIDRETVRKVRATLASRPSVRRGKTGGPRHRWLLSGIARCGKCGSQAVYGGALLPNKRAGYACRKCFGVSRDAERTDKRVVDTIKAMLAKRAFAAAARPTVDIDAMNTRREQINAELNEIAAGRFTVQQKQIQSGPLIDELDRIDAKLTDAYRGTGFEGVADAADPAAEFGKLTIAQQRKIVRALIDVTILPIKHSGAMMGPQKGWKVGDPWFRPESVKIEPRVPD
jgi:DNA invertase Pin-like site-specific DNA recombinase